MRGLYALRSGPLRPDEVSEYDSEAFLLRLEEEVRLLSVEAGLLVDLHPKLRDRRLVDLANDLSLARKRIVRAIEIDAAKREIARERRRRKSS